MKRYLVSAHRSRSCAVVAAWLGRSAAAARITGTVKATGLVVERRRRRLLQQAPGTFKPGQPGRWTRGRCSSSRTCSRSSPAPR